MVQIHDAMRHPLGAVAAPLGAPDEMRSVGPFCVVAHVLPRESDAGTLPVDQDVRAHPHIGLAAISYVLDGHITHRDNIGSRSELGPGDLGCMIAGRGVVHSERFERLRVLGGRFEMLQLLLALPDGHEDDEPSFVHLRAAQVPTVTDGGAVVRSLDGAFAFPGRVLLRDARLEPGARHVVEDGVGERAVYVMSGSVAIDGKAVEAQQIARLASGAVTVVATTTARIFVYGGDSPGPRTMWWNYIHSSLERIEEAKAAWRAGSVPLPAGDTESFTPAPPDNGRPVVRLNRLLAVSAAVVLALVVGACGGDGGSCDLPTNWSSARSGDGSTCQVNFFTQPEYAVYCGGSAGNWSCSCGPVSENPMQFTSEDFCDLEAEARACQAIERCGFPL